MNNWKKKFIIIWSGQLFSILSSSIAQFAIVLGISLETGSADNVLRDMKAGFNVISRNRGLSWVMVIEVRYCHCIDWNTGMLYSFDNEIGKGRIIC